MTKITRKGQEEENRGSRQTIFIVPVEKKGDGNGREEKTTKLREDIEIIETIEVSLRVLEGYRGGRCGPLEVFNECASPCISERTCQHQFPVEPDRCILPCEQRCECDINKGLIRDEESGNCIDIGKCEDRCGRNQFFGCRPCCPEPTCDNPKPISCIRPCPLLCINECLCKEGYLFVVMIENSGSVIPSTLSDVRSSAKASCYRKNHYIRVCPPSEIWNDCATWLPEPTCQNRFPYHPGYGPSVCYERCECDAENGYIRNRVSGECVLEECCPGCPPCEIWNDCDSCEPEPTCQNPYPNCTGIVCPLMCFPRCLCDIGYIRDEISGDCVSQESCPCK
ncbi:unnamed protein product [Diabrotica balteata]|uniref:TIL domain-containing protein n=1 Tax=Diabrotica balteata TaxID=107213 RepID=A0A9N9TDF0_DIABA|nr:unnamed protein product [Diabrotica balteata]